MSFFDTLQEATQQERHTLFNLPIIRDALEATKDLKLHHATITMDPKTHNPVDKDGVVLIAKDGKGQFFTKIKP